MKRVRGCSGARLRGSLAPALALLSTGCGIAPAVVAGLLLGAGGGGGGGGEPSLSVRFHVSSNLSLTSAVFVGQSANIVGSPQVVVISPTEYQVTMELDSVASGEAIHVTVRVEDAVLDANGQSLAVKNVAFYPVPPSQIPTQPPPPVAGPLFLWRIDVVLGIVLDVHNLNDSPMMLELDGAESDVVFDAADVYYGGITGVSWQPLASTTLGPLQSMTIDLPDDVGGNGATAALEPAAVLLRYASAVLSSEQKGLCQLELSGSPVRVETRTWGGIKALYRE